MNINEIAKLAGVSRATVSRYLNDGYVSEEKKEVIRSVIEETGYEPSTQAQNLRKQVTGLIGVIIPRLQSDSVSRMVDGISSILSKQGYQMLLANTGNSEKEELNYLQTFKKNRVDGVIFMGTVFSREHYKRMQALEVPLVVVGQQVDGYSCVYQDDYKAAKEATEQLLMTGRNIGYIGVTTRDKAARAARKRGFLDAVKGHKPSVGDNSMVEADFDVASGAKKAELLLQQNHEIDSIFCATDNIAIGALQYLNRTGIQVPTEIQLIGFGDTVMGKLVSPAITSIHFFYKTSGIEAARLLLEIIQTGEDLKKEIKMGYRLQIQASTRRVIPLS